VGLRAGLDWCGKSRPSGIRSPDRPARRQSTLQVNTEIMTLIKWVTTCLYTYNIFNIDTIYIKMVTVVTNTIYITNNP